MYLQRCPTKYQRLLMINCDYVKYYFDNSPDKCNFICNVTLLNFKRFVIITGSGDYVFKYCFRKSLDKTECIYNIVLLNIKGLSRKC